jgi:hypothetical protein
VCRRGRKIEGDEVLPRAAGSKGDKSDEIGLPRATGSNGDKGDEVGEECEGVVGLAEFAGVAGLRKLRGGEREVRETYTEFVGEGGNPG